ncbi:MAG TPA: glycoside hydrolase family 88 protein [Paludibacter sp.]
MKRKAKLIILFAAISAITVTSSGKNPKGNEWLKTALNRSEVQLLAAAEKYKNTQKNPRTFENDKVVFASTKDWTCGFFPGSLWYMYELTKNEKFKTEAQHYTEILDLVQYRKNTHDLGFMINCSYGNGFRITGNQAYKSVMINGANSLMTRFHPEVGLIKSWDNRKGWQYPVIIDNMMNLEFLYEVGKMTGETSMKAACISHADKTLLNHFRQNNSCFHVVNYDSISGKVIQKTTHQGFSDSSSWARGQAWALYGFTMMYRETKDPKYLEQAKKVAAFILNHPNLPKDKIPYWDFDAPNIPSEPRDASAAAIIASALLELSTYVKDNPIYFKTAETILKNLSSDEYLAAKGESGLFILKHSTGNFPTKSEIDVPLNYADYYYIEALGRYMKVMGIKK